MQARREQMEAKERANKNKNELGQRLKYQRLMQLFDQTEKLTTIPKAQLIIKHITSTGEAGDLGAIGLQNKTKQKQDSYMDKVEKVLGKIKEMRADLVTMKAMKMIEKQIKEERKEQRIGIFGDSSSDEKEASKKRKRGTKHQSKKDGKSFDQLEVDGDVSSIFSDDEVQSKHSVKNRRGLDLQIEFQRDLDKMEDNLRLLQDSFNNYGLDFFVNGSRKPKHAAVY